MGEVCAFLASQKLKFHSNQRWVSTASADFIFPPPQGHVFAGTKDSRPRVSPVRRPAAAECLTR